MSCEEWQLVHKKIQSINALVNKPVVYKPLELITYRLEEYLEVLPNSFFIYIERDIQDIACSIAKGRLAINKTLDKWWSSYPYEYKELRNKEWQDQIAGQVYYLKKMYDNQLQKIEPKNFIKINYKNFCNDTDGVIKTIVSKIESATRYKIKYGSVNTVLKETKPKVPNPIRIELEAALKRVYLNG